MDTGKRSRMLRLTIPLSCHASIEDKFDEMIRSTLELDHLIETYQGDIVPKEFRFPGEWPRSVNIFCWFCDRKINIPKFIPTFMRIEQTDGTISAVMGRRDELFCTFSCASAAISQLYEDDAKKWRAHNLLVKEYQMMTGDWVQSVRPAPPKIRRQKYNGEWSEEEYYEALSCVDPELLKRKAQSLGIFQLKHMDALQAFEDGFKAWGMNRAENGVDPPNHPNNPKNKVVVDRSESGWVGTVRDARDGAVGSPRDSGLLNPPSIPSIHENLNKTILCKKTARAADTVSLEDIFGELLSIATPGHEVQDDSDENAEAAENAAGGEHGDENAAEDDSDENAAGGEQGDMTSDVVKDFERVNKSAEKYDETIESIFDEKFKDMLSVFEDN